MVVRKLKKIRDEDLSKYPYLQRFLQQTKRKYNLNSDQDLIDLFNQVLQLKKVEGNNR